MSNSIVIYHANCLDGMGAAWCFREKFGKDLTFIAAKHGKEDFISDVKDYQTVYLADYCPSKDGLLELSKNNKEVIVLDHHVTALKTVQSEGLPANINIKHFTLKKSGARIAWEYLFPTEAIPKQILHIEDRDLWNFSLENTREFCSAGYDAIDSLENFSWFMAFPISNAYRDGRVIVRHQQLQINQILKGKPRFAKFSTNPGYYEIPFYNCSPEFSSEVGNELATEYGMGMTYIDHKDERVWSIRSIKGVTNCLLVAEYFGGGGHPAAAGFRTDRFHWLSRL